MKERDTLHTFLFEYAAIRGEWVHIDATLQEALKRHEYPLPLQALLGEMMAAAALLTATLKFEGFLALQIKGAGPVTLGVVECTNTLNLRGLLRWEGEIQPATLDELLGDGQLVITIEPTDGERYQGVVAVDGGGLTEALEGYLLKSEQLETRLWLAAADGHAAGLMLQRMPAEDEEEDEDAWPRAVHLAETVSDAELLELDAQTLLHRLFHEESLRLFEARPVSFRCTCSRQRVANTLRALGRDELQQLLAEQREVEVCCEFCNQKYAFDAVDVAALFVAGAMSGDTAHRH